MELPDIESMDLQNLNTWFSNIVDTMNFNLGQIEVVVPDLSMLLTNLDTPPIQDVNSTMDKLVKSINDGFQKINDRLNTLEQRSA